MKMEFPSLLLHADAGSHSNCDEEAIDVQQLHPVTDTLLSHLSLSDPLSPPTLHILLKGTGIVDRDCRPPGLLSPHMA